jgi:hypothetical protein
MSDVPHGKHISNDVAREKDWHKICTFIRGKEICVFKKKVQKSIVLTILLIIPAALFGSNNKTIPGKRKHGFYFTCPSLTYTQLNDSPSFGLGLSTGWIFNQSFSLGLGGNLFFTNIQASPSDAHNYGMSYFGIIAEYIFAAEEKIHVNLSTLIGGGIIGPWQSCTCCCNGYSSGRFISTANADGFFVWEPGIELLMNVSRTIRIGGGVHHRFVSDVNKYGFSNADLSGFSLNLIFQLGIY